MADIKIKARIDVDTSDAEKDLSKTKKSIEKAGDELDKTGKEAKKAGGAFGSLSSALKTLGIASAIDAGLGMLKDTMMKNQTVANLVTTSMNFLNRAFNDLVGFIGKNIGPAMDWLSEKISNPKKALTDLAIAIKDNLMERLRSLVDMLGYVGETLYNLITLNFDKAKESMKNAGKELLDVVTGVSNTAGIWEKGAKAIAEYSKETWNAAEAQTKLQNNAKLSAASLQGLVEYYDRQAEQLRQIRDNENLSITDRINANTKLGQTLKDQQSAMLALADAKIKAAKADLAVNQGNIDLQVAVKNAMNERAAIMAQITGLQSEQLVNATALGKELLAMNQALAASDNAINLEKRKAAAELIPDELKRLDELKKIRAEERNIELKRLQDNIDATTEGTQARVDALIAYNEKKAELDAADLEDDKKIADIKIEREKTLYDQKVELLNLEAITVEERRVAEIAAVTADYDAKIALAQKNGEDTVNLEKIKAQKIVNINKKAAEDEKAIDTAKLTAKIQFLQAIGSAIGALGGLFAQGTAASKVAAIAEIGIGTATGYMNALDIAQKSARGVPGPGAAFAFPIFYASQIAAVLGAVSKAKSILSQVKGGGAVGSISAGSDTASMAAPLRPEVMTTALDAGSIQGIGNAAAGGVGRSYVLDSDIKNSDERQQRLQRAARLS